MALTTDGRLVAGCVKSDRLDDITQAIRGRLREQTNEPFTSIHVYKGTLVATAGAQVCLILIKVFGYNNKYEVFGAESSCYTFPSGQGEVFFGAHHGFLKSQSNLCLVGSGSVDICKYLLGNEADRNLVSVRFDAKTVSKIICGRLFSLFIMNDSSVKAHGFTNLGLIQKPDTVAFHTVVFPETDIVSVSKIVTKGSSVLYLTTDGACYYGDVENLTENTVRKPVLLKDLAGRYVENAFIIEDLVIVQYREADKSKLCLLRTIPHDRLNQIVPNVQSVIIDPAYKDGTVSPTELPFFDGKHITSVMRTEERVYLTTGEGLVYHTTIDTIESDPESEPFFVENPVAVESNSQNGSASSCL